MRPRKVLASSPPSDRSHETRTPAIRRPNRPGRTKRATVSTSGSSGIRAAYPASFRYEMRVCKSVKKSTRDEPRGHSCVQARDAMRNTSKFASLLCKWLSLSLVIMIGLAPSVRASAPALETASLSTQAGRGWRVRAKDNICGLSSPRQVNLPATIDYKQVLKATPEMKDLARRNINPRSAEGQILRQRAADRVRRASSLVMQSHGHCSVWKRISHRDGRKIDDVTKDVIATLNAV